MVVKIRLARFGRTNSPFYNIVVTQARTARGSRPMEVLGTYDPRPRPDTFDTAPSLGGNAADAKHAKPMKLYKDIQLDITRTKYWIGVGAQPTDTAWRILSMAGIVEPKRKSWLTTTKPCESTEQPAQ